MLNRRKNWWDHFFSGPFFVKYLHFQKIVGQICMYVYIYIYIYVYIRIYVCRYIYIFIYIFIQYLNIYIFFIHDIHAKWNWCDTGVYMVHDMPQTVSFFHQHAWLDDPKDQVCRFLGTVGYLDVLLSWWCDPMTHTSPQRWVVFCWWRWNLLAIAHLVMRCYVYVGLTAICACASFWARDWQMSGFQGKNWLAWWNTFPGWWQLKYFCYFQPYLGKWSNLTIIFFGWVGSTTN